MAELRKIDTPTMEQLPALDSERITITWDDAWASLLCDDWMGDRIVQAARKRLRRKWHRRHKGR